MLEISLKHDDQEIQLLRVSDDIDTDAVVNLLRAALEAHKKTLSAAGQPKIKETVPSNGRPRKGVGRPDKSSSVRLTSNAQAVLAALSRLGEPFAEARALDPLLQQDPHYKGSSIETIRLYLRQFENEGWMEKTPDGKRRLSPQGREAAARYARVDSLLLDDEEGRNTAEDSSEGSEEPAF